MTSFLYNTVADIEPLRFGGCLMYLLTRLDLPLPTIRGSTMKKLHKDGCWGVKVIQPGQERGKNPEEDIAIHIVSDSKEKTERVLEAYLWTSGSIYRMLLPPFQ